MGLFMKAYTVNIDMQIYANSEEEAERIARENIIDYQDKRCSSYYVNETYLSNAVVDEDE